VWSVYRGLQDAMDVLYAMNLGLGPKEWGLPAFPPQEVRYFPKGSAVAGIMSAVRRPEEGKVDIVPNGAYPYDPAIVSSCLSLRPLSEVLSAIPECVVGEVARGVMLLQFTGLTSETREVVVGPASQTGSRRGSLTMTLAPAPRAGTVALTPSHCVCWRPETDSPFCRSQALWMVSVGEVVRALSTLALGPTSGLTSDQNRAIMFQVYTSDTWTAAIRDCVKFWCHTVASELGALRCPPFDNGAMTSTFARARHMSLCSTGFDVQSALLPLVLFGATGVQERASVAMGISGSSNAIIEVNEAGDTWTCMPAVRGAWEHFVVGFRPEFGSDPDALKMLLGVLGAGALVGGTLTGVGTMDTDGIVEGRARFTTGTNLTLDLTVVPAKDVRDQERIFSTADALLRALRKRGEDPFTRFAPAPAPAPAAAAAPRVHSRSPGHAPPPPPRPRPAQQAEIELLDDDDAVGPGPGGGPGPRGPEDPRVDSITATWTYVAREAIAAARACRDSRVHMRTGAIQMPYSNNNCFAATAMSILLRSDSNKAAVKAYVESNLDSVERSPKGLFRFGAWAGLYLIIHGYFNGTRHHPVTSVILCVSLLVLHEKGIAPRVLDVFAQAVDMCGLFQVNADGTLSLELQQNDLREGLEFLALLWENGNGIPGWHPLMLAYPVLRTSNFDCGSAHFTEKREPMSFEPDKETIEYARARRGISGGLSVSDVVQEILYPRRVESVPSSTCEDCVSAIPLARFNGLLADFAVRIRGIPLTDRLAEALQDLPAITSEAAMRKLFMDLRARAPEAGKRVMDNVFGTSHTRTTQLSADSSWDSHETFCVTLSTSQASINSKIVEAVTVFDEGPFVVCATNGAPKVRFRIMAVAAKSGDVSGGHYWAILRVTDRGNNTVVWSTVDGSSIQHHYSLKDAIDYNRVRFARFPVAIIETMSMA